MKPILKEGTRLQRRLAKKFKVAVEEVDLPGKGLARLEIVRHPGGAAVLVSHDKERVLRVATEFAEITGGTLQ